MTYNNRPAVLSTVADFVADTTYRAYTVDVTNVVRKAAMTGEKYITFVYLGGVKYITNLYSCEASSEMRRPALLVSEVPMQICRSMERYEAEADTYVTGTYPAENYGTADILKAKNVSVTENHRIGYFRFEIPELQSMDTIALRLYLSITQSNTPEDAEMVCTLATADSDWDEYTVTYETRPEVLEEIAEFTVKGTSYQPYTIDVTEAVRTYAERGETEITFAFLGGAAYIASAYSREAAAGYDEYKPCLSVCKGFEFLNADGDALEGITANSEVTCVLKQTLVGGKVIFASYQGKNLSGACIADANEGTTLTVKTGADVFEQHLRTFIWDETLTPMAPVVEFYNPFSVSKSLLTELAEPGESELVKELENGTLVYFPYTEEGDILPDFSGVGYMGGAEEFPTSSRVLEVEPVSGDDTATIQMAISTVASYTPDSNGIRGVVLLKNGDYEVSGTIYISTSGVILRGESRDGTVIHATGDSTQDSVVSVSGPASVTEDSAYTKIDLAYVPVGTKVLPLVSAAGLSVGDEIVIVRPPSEQWITDIGMDANGIFASSTNETVTPWKAAAYEFHFERKIVAIDGNNITIDHPVVMSMEERYGGGQVRKVLKNQRISQVGVEDITFESNYDTTVLDGTTYVDENHANRAVQFNNAQHCWAKELTARYFINECVEIASTSKYVTVTDCSATDFVSVITGSRRYAFEINGQMSLVKNCVSDNARHAFVQGARVCGPNVFYNCASTNDHSTSEPHHRWAMGCLYDNVSVSRGLQAVQRGDYGTGHGWAGANMVFWNCAGPHIGVMQPPTAQNFAIGISVVPETGAEEIAQRWIRSINKQAGTSFLYTGYPFAGDGYMELPNRPAAIESLYLAQQINFMNE